MKLTNKPFSKDKPLYEHAIDFVKYLTINHFIFHKGTWYPFPSLFWSIRKLYRSKFW